MDQILLDKQPNVAASGITGVLTLTKSGTTARTATFPDAAIVVAGSADALTSGLIPQAGSGGVLADSALGTSAITGVLTLTKAGTTARTVTFPDAAITVAGINLAQTWTATQSFDAISASSQITSTVSTGTAPLVIASTTVVSNLNAALLNGATFSAPGAIGGGTPGSGAFTTVSATGQITSTLATGTAPFSIASTTVVANLNASLLGGATFSAPGAIGGGTPGSGAFTTVSATGQITSTLASGAGLTVSSTTASTAYTNGCAVFAGGIGVAGNSYFNGTLNVASTLSVIGGQFYVERSTTSGVTGAVRVTGDGVDRFRIRAGGALNWSDGAAASDCILERTAAGILTFTSTKLTVTDTTDATTTSDGSVRLSGGLSVAKSCVIGGTAGNFLNIANSTGELRINGTKVHGAQGAAVADASGGAIIDAEARTAINTLLARLRTHGIIAT